MNEAETLIKWTTERALKIQLEKEDVQKWTKKKINENKRLFDRLSKV